ncbi:MAG: hypothetical protein EXQ70_11335 [Solirubrobacterales bacterium]|nr:hypothetical protein [Solirubrobacterales bacterium]
MLRDRNPDRPRVVWLPLVNRLGIALAATAIASLALLAFGCGGGSDDDSSSSSGDVALSTDTCGELEYGGDGDPQALIVTDLPMQGDSKERSEQQVEAVKLALEQAGWKAGDVTVGFQACDDSVAKTGLWDEQTCTDNATAYAAHEPLLGVVGTYNSGCAAIEIPILNKANVAIVSPGNTAVCLTEESVNCEDGQPESLYPNGKRNYARVVPNDAFQGAGLVTFAQDQGIDSPFVLYAADDPTSTGQARNFVGAAQEAGLDLVGQGSWDPDAKDYNDLFSQIAGAGADGIILAGLTDQNGGKLIDDKVSILGDNTTMPLLAFDGFAQQSTIDEAGAPSAGMFASVPGRSPEKLSGTGAKSVKELEGRVGGKALEFYAPYAGEAAEVLLDAIATAGDERDAVSEAVLTTKRKDGILGTYEFTPTGDPSVGQVTILVAGDTFTPEAEVTPEASLVRAARN